MDFSTMSDEELLKPDAGTDFSAMSDEELLKPDAQDDISKLSDEELLKPDAPQDLEQLSDEELLKPDAQPSQTQEQPTQDQPAAETQQPAPVEQPQDTHWQEMDERARQFNLGDAISDAAETVGKTIGKGLNALESGKRRLEGILFPAGSLQSEMAAGGGAVAGKMMKTAANVPLNAIEAAGNMFGQDQVRDFAVRAKKFIDQKIDTTTEPLVTGNPEWDKKLSKFSEMGTNAVATLFAYAVPGAATVDIAATSINTFFNRLREGLDKGMTFNKASAMALVDAGLEGLKGVTIRRLLKGASGPGAFFDKLVEEGLTALKFAGIDAAQDVIQQGFEGADNPDMTRAKERGQEGLENAVVFQTIAGASRKAAGVVFDKNTDPKKGIQDLEAEREQARQKSIAEEVASKFTPEQETALNERIPEFIGADTDLQIRVRDRIAAKMKREAAEGSPVGKDPLRTRLDDPAEMEKEIQTAVEELLFEDNATEIAKSVNTDTLGVKAGDQIVELVKVMPRTADKTESRLAGEIRAVNPEMSSERVWELAEYLAAHEGEIGRDGKPLTKERVAEVEKLMSEDASGTVPVEQPDGSLKTVGEMEAEAAREERKNLPPDETKQAPDETNVPVPERKPVGLSGKWTPVDGKSGVWHTPEFPDVEIALQDAPVAEAEPGKAPGKIMFIENLPEPSALDENGQMKLGKFLVDQLDIATKAGIKEINIGKTPEDAAKYSELVDKYEAKISGDKFQARADGVLGVLKKSGLATEVVATEAEFNAKLEQEGYAMRAKDGRTYGFTDGQNVYLNPAFFRAREGLNTPIHEFGHLGIEATKKINRPLYDRGIELIKQTGLFKEVSEHPDYAAGSEEARATEALTRLIATRGENLEANTPKGVITEIKKWLVEFWKSVGQSLGIRDLTPEQISKMTVEDVADAIRAEMMSGREFGTRELSLQEGDLKAKILRFAKYQKPTSKNAKAALDAAKKVWKGLSEEQKTALGQYGDTAVLKTPEARTIANGVKTLREWDARRAKISAQVKEQIRKSPNEAQKKFITSSPKYYISEVAGDATSPFAYAVEKGLPIPRKGDWGWDAWERLTDGMKYKERRELEKILGGEHPKRGGMDTVLSDYAQWLGISWDEGARDFEHGRGIEDFLDDILKERERFEKWRSGDRMTRTEAEAERAGAEASQHENEMTDAEFAEEDAWVRASEARRVEAERMGEQDDLSDMPAFSRAPRGDAIESNIRQMLKHDKVYDPSDSLHFAYSASQNEIAFFHDNGDLTFDIIARDKLTPNGIKRVTEFSKFYRTDENGENLDKSIQEFKSSVRSGNMGGGSKAQNGTSADANGDLALGRQDNGPKPDRRKGAGTGAAGSVSGIQFSRGSRAVFVGGRTRVADDAEHGERSPGGLAAARELADVRNSPVSALGARRFLSLSISDMEELRKIVTGDVVPTAVAKNLPSGGIATRRGGVTLHADVIGTVDRTDMDVEKATLKAHGFFRNEDPSWSMGQTDAAIRAEKQRSDAQLERQLIALGERRINRQEPGAQTAERGVFADQVAKIVMAEKRHVGGRLGRLQTIGKKVQDAVANMPGMNAADAEWAAKRFIDWAYGIPDYSQNMSGKELTAEMFGKWLVMPKEVEARAPKWANGIEGVIAGDRNLADAFRTLADRRLHGDEYLIEKIRKQMSRQTQETLNRLNNEKDEPISAGSTWKDLTEQFIYGMHDRFGPVYIRMDAETKTKIKAMKKALKAAPPAARPALKQQLDLYLGDLADKLNKLELARTAYERGNLNEGSVYHREMLRLENEATERWGLTTEDMSFYLDQWRVIETSGRSASFGEDVVQARRALGDMANRLGAQKWRRMQEFGNRWWAVHERELLDDPRAERMFGKAWIDYLRQNTHYVSTERVHSQEEIDAIDSARRAARAAGVAGGDDIVSQCYDYAGAKGAGKDIGEGGWTARMTGSFAAKADVRGATLKKVDRLQMALRRNQLVLDLRDALEFAGVKGVRDLPRSEGAEFPSGSRYGHLNYIENGKKRTLVVPRQIADAFATGETANWYTKTTRMIHNTWRSLIIDWNPAYWPMNVRRNQDSIEKNVPGMRETYLKTALRATFPGLGTLSDLALQTVVRNIPATAKAFSDKTVFYYIPQAERICKIVESPSEWQQMYWDAQDRNDLAKIQQMNEDWRLAKEMLKANMFVSIGSVHRGENSQTFAADQFAKKGLRTIQEIDRALQSRSRGKRALDTLCWVAKKNQAQQEHEDVLAKAIAYLADRKHFGLVRTSAESGDLVNRRVSIAQGERKGAAAGTMKLIIPFYNMIEKGVVRHFNAYKTDFGHTLGADAKFVVGRVAGSLMANGTAMYLILSNYNNDEKKIPWYLRKFYDYAKAYHDAWRNCSEYVRKNYQFTPVWTKGYTSIIIGGAMTDEEKLLSPIVDYTANAIAASEGIGEMPSFGSAILDSTVRAVVPDLQMTGPIIEGLRLAVVAATGENQTDYFRDAPMFDQRTLDNRFASAEDFKDFAAVVGARLWNYAGGRSVIAAGVNGVDNGRGEAPKPVEWALSDIPWISPLVNRMVKIQVGSPDKDTAAIKAQRKSIDSLLSVCAERMLERKRDGMAFHEHDWKGYEAQIQKYAQTYKLDEVDVAKLRGKYLNGFNQWKCRSSYDQKTIAKLKEEARRQGRTESAIWVMLGER